MLNINPDPHVTGMFTPLGFYRHGRFLGGRGAIGQDPLPEERQGLCRCPVGSKSEEGHRRDPSRRSRLQGRTAVPPARSG